jgi:hypothetical protein
MGPRLSETRDSFLTRLHRERDPKHYALWRAHTAVFSSLSPPFGRLGSSADLDRPFGMVWRELPKWDCTGEAHFKRGERR